MSLPPRAARWWQRSWSGRIEPPSSATATRPARASGPRQLAEDLADAYAPLNFRLELLQFGTQRVARRHHANGLAVFNHRHVAEAALVHQQQGIGEGFVGSDGLR